MDVYYNTYECKFCNAVTYNDSPDCNKCKEKFCMYARSITENE